MFSFSDFAAISLAVILALAVFTASVYGFRFIRDSLSELVRRLGPRVFVVSFGVIFTLLLMLFSWILSSAGVVLSAPLWLCVFCLAVLGTLIYQGLILLART